MRNTTIELKKIQDTLFDLHDEFDTLPNKHKKENINEMLILKTALLDFVNTIEHIQKVTVY